MAKSEQASSRMDTVLKMLLIAFVSLLAFSSGVYFGKQMSDSDHQLKALESDFNTQSTLTAQESAKDGKDGVTEEDVAAISDKYVNEEKESGQREVASEKAEAVLENGKEKSPSEHVKNASEHTKTPAAVHSKATENDASESEASNAGGPDLSVAHRAAERVANNASPVSIKPEAKITAAPETRVPTSLPKTVGTDGSVEFTVQVASYPTPEAAKAAANDLVKKGFPAFPVEATISGRTWYRVSVGSFKTMKAATTYRAQLLKQADLQNAIVQKITR